MANANVGDKPQIDNEASDEDLEDLFGDTKLNTEGRRLRKQLKQKAGNEDMYGDPDSVCPVFPLVVATITDKIG